MSELLSKFRKSAIRRALAVGDAATEMLATTTVAVKTAEVYSQGNSGAGDIGLAITAGLLAKTLWDTRGIRGHSTKIVNRNFTGGVNSITFSGILAPDVYLGMNPPVDNPTVKGAFLLAAGYSACRVLANLAPALRYVNERFSKRSSVSVRNGGNDK